MPLLHKNLTPQDQLPSLRSLKAIAQTEEVAIKRAPVVPIEAMVVLIEAMGSIKQRAVNRKDQWLQEIHITPVLARKEIRTYQVQ